MNWDEGKHPRDAEGQFTHSTIGAWANAAAARLNRGVGEFSRMTQETARSGNHPAGHAAAKARLRHLWDIPDRSRGIERTDAEQAELEELESAFETYRFKLGLGRDPHSASLHVDQGGKKWSEYGEFIGNVTDEPPRSLQRGFTRVGDAPDGEGKVGGADPRYYTPSRHPAAGGLWIDPARPGTRHAPRYLNDMGDPMTELLPPKSRSEEHKDELRGRRWFGNFGNDGIVEHVRTRGGKQIGVGRMGYDSEGTSAEFLAAMKRKKARTRQERAGVVEQRRRTPRGTVVEGWMAQVDKRMGARRG